MCRVLGHFFLILIVLAIVANDAAAIQMVTGIYEGNGQANHPITGIGFQPDIVIIKGDLNEPSVIRTSTMPPNTCKPLGPKTGLLPDRIKSLDADGFTVGSDVLVNASFTTYYFVAIKAWPQKVEVGSYPGNHTDGRLIPLGFEPTYVIVMDEIDEVAMQRFKAEAFDKSLPFDANDEKGDRIEDFLPTGFLVGTHNTVNETGHMYHYIAWKEHPNTTSSDVYPGNGFDNRDITAAGFDPTYVILSRQNNGSGTVQRSDAIAGDVTLPVDAGLSFTNGIQAFLPNGFQVGWDPRVNANNEDYFWVALRGRATVTQPIVASAIPDTTVSEDNPPIDNYRDLNDVFDDTEDGSVMAFTIEDNSNPALVTASIDADSALDLSISPSQTGFATIVVRATDFDDMFVEDTLTVTVIANKPPVLDLDDDDSSGRPGADFAATFSEGDGAVPIADNDALVIDEDSPTLDSLIVTLKNPLDGANEVLTANTGGTGISSSYSGGVLTLVGPAPPGVFQQVLRTIVYDNVSPTPDRSDRVIEFVANDGEDRSNTATTFLSFCVQNVRDEFNAVSYDGNDGSANWSGAWKEIGEGDGPAGGIVRVSTNAMRIGGNGVDIDNRGLMREADLSGAVSATLSYTYQRQLLGFPGGFIVVSISSDGFLWSLLTFHSLDVTDINPVSQVFDISSYASPNTLIRFQGFGGFAGSYFFADDVQIQYDICNPNAPPKIASAIPDTTVAEDSGPIDNYRDLNNVFIDDEDGNALRFSIRGNSNPGLVTTVIDADSALDMSFFPDQNGDATIVVRATDSGGKIVEDTLVVTVTPSNDPPVVASAIPDTTVTEDSGPIDNYRDLNDIFADLEDGNALTFTIEDNSNPSLVNASIDPDSALDLSFAPEQAGSASIIIRATDSGALYAEDTLVVTVTQVNDPPTVASAMPDTTVAEDSPPLDNYRDLNDVFSDLEDGNALTFTIEDNSNPSLVTAVIDPDSALDLGIAPDRIGSASIIIRATDSGALYAEDTLVVTVTQVNDPPTVASAIPDTTVVEDSPPLDNYRDLNDVFSDLEDGSVLTFTIEDNSDPSLVTAIIDPDSALDLGIAPNRIGNVSIVIRATDFGALYAEDTLVVTVTQVNDPPTVASAIPDTIVAQDSAPIDDYRDLNDVFEDLEDGSTLSFSVVSNTNPGLVNVTIGADSALDLSMTAGQSGSAAVIVRATDSGALAAEDTFAVTVSSKVTIIDVAGSAYPSATFINDPQLSLRIGVDNVSVVGVMLDTTSTIFFSDGTNDYVAALANPTYVPPAADNFTLTYAPEPVPPGIIAPAYYDFTLNLYGVDDASFPFADTVSTAGRNNIFIDTPKIRISARPLDVEDVSPGERSHPILLMDYQNGYPDERLLNSLVVTNVSFGPGTPAQLDGEIETIYLFDDVDSSLGLSPADTVVAQTVFASSVASFAIAGNWRIPGSSRRALIATIDIDSVLARDGDELDALVNATSDVVFQGNTLIADDFSPLYPLDSFGRLVVNGMVSHQMSITPTLLDTLDSGSDDNWLFTVTIPQNGYEPDTLTGFSIKNYSPDTISSDHLTLRLHRDNGNGTLDPGVDEELGPLVHSGDRIQITGLNVPLSPNAVMFVTADVSVDLDGTKQFRPGIPMDGIEVTSANDGPIDNELVSSTSFVIRKVDKIDIVNLPLGQRTPRPAVTDVPMLLLSIENNTAYPVELDTLTLNNASAGVGSLNDLDRAFAEIKILDDDGNGTVDSWDTVVADQLVFSAGQFTAIGLNLSFSADEQRHLLVIANIDSFCASDGDTLRVELFSEASLGFDTDTGVTGVFPMPTSQQRVVDGMMAHQIELASEPDSLIVSGGTNMLLFEFCVPANGYQIDTLQSVEIENLGSASSEHFELLALYQDGGNGAYDGGSVDDIYHGDFSENLATPGIRDYEIVGLALPLLAICEQTTTFFVGGEISDDYTVGGSIQFSIPVMGIGVASGNDGPIDTPIEDPSVRVIPKPDQLTVFPYSVGDQIVYPGSEKNLNFGIGFYNGYSYELTLDQLKLFQAGTASSMEIDSVFAYADIDTNGLFDPYSDLLVAESHSDGASYTLESIALTLPSERVSYIYIGYDIPLHVRDSVSVDIKLFDEDGITVEPDNTDIEGEFPINSPGLDVTDGLVAKQIELFSVPDYRAAPGDQDVAAVSIKIPTNGIWPDRLDYLSIENIGSAVSGTDIDNVRLWIEAGGDPDAFDPIDDQPLAFLNWNGAVWKNSLALNENIPLGGLRSYVSFSVSNTPTDGATFRANIPMNGIQVTSGNDGPLDETIANPSQQTISTDPLISELRADRSAYSIGQSIVLDMFVRNEGVDTLFGVSPASLAINGSGAVALMSGPLPVSFDLSPGEDSTITWIFSADIPGEITFCGHAHDGDSSVVSEQTCSRTLELQNRASTIPLSISNSAPASANRGQSDIPLFKIGLSYDQFDSLSAPVRFTSARLNLQNGSGTPIPPNTILNKITFLNTDGTGHVFSLTDSTTNPLHLEIPDPTVLLPGDSLVVNATCEITSGAPFTSFRLSIEGLDDVGVVDANDGNPIALSTTESFPWRTTDIFVNERAESLLVSADTPQVISANTGQEDVSLISLSLLNRGNPNTASEIITGLTLNFFDTTGSGIPPAQIIYQLDIRSGDQLLFTTQDVPSIGNEIVAILTTPFVVAPELIEQIAVVVGLKDFPQIGAFYATVPDPHSIVVRDINNAQIVAVSAMEPTTIDFPLASNRILFENPASGLSASYVDNTPESILPSTSYVPIMDLILNHADSSLSSSLLVDSLAFRFVKFNGDPFFPGDYFSTLYVVNSEDTLSRVTSLSSVQPLAECKFDNAVTIAPATSETLSVYLDSKSLFAPDAFEIRLSEQHIVVRDGNDGKRQLGLSGEFPFVVGPIQLQIPSGAVQLGIISRIPQNVAATTEGIEAFDLVLENGNPPGHTPAELRELRVTIEDSKGKKFEPAKLLSRAQIVGPDSTVVTGQIDPDAISFVIPSGGVLVSPSTRDTLTFVADMNAKIKNVNLRFVIRNASASEVIDAVTSDTLTVGTLNNVGYPLRTTFTHVLGGDPQQAFTNYPNPFAAGRGTTRITYYLGQPSTVRLTIYTVWGAPVRTLLDNKRLQPGLHQDVTWDGQNGDGDVVNNGTYLMILETRGEDGSQTTFRRKVGVVR